MPVRSEAFASIVIRLVSWCQRRKLQTRARSKMVGKTMENPSTSTKPNHWKRSSHIYPTPIPSPKLTVRTWKWMVGILVSFWGPAYFQAYCSCELLVSGRGTSSGFPLRLWGSGFQQLWVRPARWRQNALLPPWCPAPGVVHLTSSNTVIQYIQLYIIKNWDTIFSIQYVSISIYI